MTESIARTGSMDAKLAVEDGVATVTLAGELEADSIQRFHELLSAATGVPLRRLVLDLSGLRRLSSAALRCLAVVQQRLGASVPVVVVGAGGDVAAAIRLSGLGDSLQVLGEEGR